MVLVAGSVDNKKILLGTCKLICMMIVWNGEIIRLNVLVRTADRRLMRYDVLMWWMGTGLERLQ